MTGHSAESMKEVDKNFGVIIAFLLPGFILLWGLSFSSDAVSSWLAVSSADKSASVGDFLYSTLASLALGLIISAARWLLVDHVLGWMGVKDPGLNFRNLKEKDVASAFSGAIENHYRYYQYYANTLVAIIGAFSAYVGAAHHTVVWKAWVGAIAIVAILFLGSRDALTKYYDRAAEILK
jgi:ABC-type long-subunit fatty acid transport system fused permease/ATPase subunit